MIVSQARTIWTVRSLGRMMYLTSWQAIVKKTKPRHFGLYFVRKVYPGALLQIFYNNSVRNRIPAANTLQYGFSYCSEYLRSSAVNSRGERPNSRRPQSRSSFLIDILFPHTTRAVTLRTSRSQILCAELGLYVHPIMPAFISSWLAWAYQMWNRMLG